MSEYPYILRFYYRLFGPRLGLVFLLALAAVFFDVLSVTLFLPLLQGTQLDDPVTKTVAPMADLVPFGSDFTKVLSLMVATVAVRSIFMLGQRAYVARLSNYLLSDVRHEYARRYFASDYRYMMSKDIGWVNNALTVEFQRVVLGFEQGVVVLAGLVMAIIYFAVPLTLAPVLVLAFLTVGIPGYFAIKWINERTAEYSVGITAYSARLQGWLIQSLRHEKYLKSTSSERPVLSRLQEITRSLASFKYRSDIVGEISGAGLAPPIILAIAIGLYVEVEVRNAPIIESVFVLFLVKRSFDNFQAIQQAYRKTVLVIGSLRVFDQFDQELVRNQEPVTATGSVPALDGEFVLDEVSYEYDPGTPVLQDISISIPARSMVAFVGESGAGKSTLASLLTGTLSPTSGSITLDGVPYARLNLKLLRESIGYVTQESVMFNDTVLNNISLWSPDIEQRTIEDAAEKASASRTISALPGGYSSILGDDGVRLSGGQRQRIAIARELAKHPRLLILDEATSSLDSRTELQIKQAIDRMKGDATIVMISHRLSTVMAADVIYVLEHGRIVESGTFDELRSQGGEFSRMASAQGWSAIEYDAEAARTQAAR